jgi:acyl-CoA reductase-like NAD-dependent aldehyde dehydrogenase
MGVTVTQNKNFVNGKWVDAVEGGTMEVLNPATGETIAEVRSPLSGLVTYVVVSDARASDDSATFAAFLQAYLRGLAALGFRRSRAFRAGPSLAQGPANNMKLNRGMLWATSLPPPAKISR